MDTIDWSKIYETGHPVVDGQHRNLFKLIKDLNFDMQQQDSKVTVADSIDKLSSYVATHFKTEEDLMKAMSYPDYEVHKIIHDGLKEQSEKLIKLYKLGKVDLTATISKFLSDWLKHHIQDIDMKMIAWLKENETDK